MSVVTGCIASGIEILSNRVNLANEFRGKLVSQMKIPDWIMKTTKFVRGNAASQKGPMLVDGFHATHVYMFSTVFSDNDIELLAARLNLTNFKVLVCALKPRQEQVFLRLDCVHPAAPVEINMTGSGQRFKMCVFIKISSL